MTRLGFVLALVGCVACSSSDEVLTDGGSSRAGTGAGGSAGGGAGHGGAGSGGAGDGGVVHDAAVGADASSLGDAARQDDAGSMLGDGGAVCDQPIEVGPCDAAIPRYAWDAAAGACVLFSFGGCQGNQNNFAFATECLRACAPKVDSGQSLPDAACMVGHNVYPSGTQGIGDPHSCNTCVCTDGQLACTEINCPNACPADTKAATVCRACGPVDNCEVVEHGCLPTCSGDPDCLGIDQCVNGVCGWLCG